MVVNDCEQVTRLYRSTLLGLPNTKHSFDFNVGRGQLVMHDGMQYDPIHGKGHEPLKVEMHF